MEAVLQPESRSAPVKNNKFWDVPNCPEALGGELSVCVIVYISEEHGQLHFFLLSYFRKHGLLLTSLTASGSAVVGSANNSLCQDVY